LAISYTKWNHPDNKRVLQYGVLCIAGVLFFFIGLPVGLTWLKMNGLLSIKTNVLSLITFSGLPIGALCMFLSVHFLNKFDPSKGDDD
jgi:hypothetical protein